MNIFIGFFVVLRQLYATNIITKHLIIAQYGYSENREYHKALLGTHRPG